MIPALSPMSPLDQNEPFLADFSNVLDSSDAISSVVCVTAVPSDITIGKPSVTAGVRPACAVLFTLGAGAAGTTYTITVEIIKTSGPQIARSLFVPVGGV